MVEIQKFKKIQIFKIARVKHILAHYYTLSCLIIFLDETRMRGFFYSQDTQIRRSMRLRIQSSNDTQINGTLKTTSVLNFCRQRSRFCTLTPLKKILDEFRMRGFLCCA